MKIGPGGFLVDDAGNRIKAADGSEINLQEVVQKLIDSKIAEERKGKDGLQARIDELTTQLATAKAEDRNALQARIDELQQQAETTEQRAARKFAEKEREYTLRVEETSKQLSQWQERWRAEVLNTGIAKTAAELNFIKPDYLDMILRPRAQWEQATDAEGKPLDQWAAKFKMLVPPADGKGDPQERLLSLREAAEVVAKTETHLVKGTGSGGSGYQPGAGNPQQPPTGLASIYKTK